MRKRRKIERQGAKQSLRRNDQQQIKAEFLKISIKLQTGVSARTLSVNEMLPTNLTKVALFLSELRILEIFTDSDIFSPEFFICPAQASNLVRYQTKQSAKYNLCR